MFKVNQEIVEMKEVFLKNKKTRLKKSELKIPLLKLYENYSLSRKIVCSRLGPTEAIEMGIPISSSIKLI